MRGPAPYLALASLIALAAPAEAKFFRSAGVGKVVKLRNEAYTRMRTAAGGGLAEPLSLTATIGRRGRQATFDFGHHGQLFQVKITNKKGESQTVNMRPKFAADYSIEGYTYWIDGGARKEVSSKRELSKSVAKLLDLKAVEVSELLEHSWIKPLKVGSGHRAKSLLTLRDNFFNSEGAAHLQTKAGATKTETRGGRSFTTPRYFYLTQTLGSGKTQREAKIGFDGQGKMQNIELTDRYGQQSTFELHGPTGFVAQQIVNGEHSWKTVETNSRGALIKALAKATGIKLSDIKRLVIGAHPVPIKTLLSMKQKMIAALKKGQTLELNAKGKYGTLEARKLVNDKEFIIEHVNPTGLKTIYVYNNSDGKLTLFVEHTADHSWRRSYYSTEMTADQPLLWTLHMNAQGAGPLGRRVVGKDGTTASNVELLSQGLDISSKQAYQLAGEKQPGLLRRLGGMLKRLVPKKKAAAAPAEATPAAPAE
ncbi:MAG: hypothetical protein H6707_20605 [Deltaproteobacteria bacterium]|nr:hypothetical protein [Deltaproteobacteria bacterium]